MVFCAPSGAILPTIPSDISCSGARYNAVPIRPEKNELPQVALLRRRNPEAGEEVGSQQIQDVFGPAGRDRSSAAAPLAPESAPHPRTTVRAPVLSASARTTACNRWLRFPLAPAPASWHKKLGLLRSRVTTAASPPHRSSYPARQFAGSAYANHIR